MGSHRGPSWASSLLFINDFPESLDWVSSEGYANDFKTILEERSACHYSRKNRKLAYLKQDEVKHQEMNTNAQRQSASYLDE